MSVEEAIRERRARHRDPMLTATASATVTGEDGQPETITAGRTRVDPEHWLAVNYPHLFGRAPSRSRWEW